MTIETASTYTLDAANLLHDAAGRFASRATRQDWDATLVQAAQALNSWIVVCGCKLGLAWAQMEACKTLALTTTVPLHTTLTNPETGESESVPVGEVSTFVPWLPSSWVGAITWESTDLYPEIGTVTVYGKAGNQIYRREGQTLATLLSILRADVTAKSTSKRSIGATVLHYFGRKAQPKKSSAVAAYDPFVRNVVVNGQMLTASL